jgi:hypothetical protein
MPVLVDQGFVDTIAVLSLSTMGRQQMIVRNNQNGVPNAGDAVRGATRDELSRKGFLGAAAKAAGGAALAGAGLSAVPALAASARSRDRARHTSCARAR